MSKISRNAFKACVIVDKVQRSTYAQQAPRALFPSLQMKKIIKMRSIVSYLACNVTSMYYPRCLYRPIPDLPIPQKPETAAALHQNQIFVLTVNCRLPAPVAAHTHSRKFTKGLGQEELDSAPIIVQLLHLFPPPVLPLLVDVTKRVEAPESGFQGPSQVFLTAL